MRIPNIADYPKVLHLGTETYKLKFVKGMKLVGSTDPSKKEIRIRAGMSKNETFSTAIHEILHMIELEWPVKLKHKQIYKLESALFSFISDNFT